MPEPGTPQVHPTTRAPEKEEQCPVLPPFSPSLFPLPGKSTRPGLQRMKLRPASVPGHGRLWSTTLLAVSLCRMSSGYLRDRKPASSWFAPIPACEQPCGTLSLSSCGPGLPLAQPKAPGVAPALCAVIADGGFRAMEENPESTGGEAQRAAACREEASSLGSPFMVEWKSLMFALGPAPGSQVPGSRGWGLSPLPRGQCGHNRWWLSAQEAAK